MEDAGAKSAKPRWRAPNVGWTCHVLVLAVLLALALREVVARWGVRAGDPISALFNFIEKVGAPIAWFIYALVTSALIRWRGPRIAFVLGVHVTLIVGILLVYLLDA